MMLSAFFFDTTVAVQNLRIRLSLNHLLMILSHLMVIKNDNSQMHLPLELPSENPCPIFRAIWKDWVLNELCAGIVLQKRNN